MIFFLLLNIFVEILIHFSAFVYEYKIFFYKSFLLINVVLNINFFFYLTFPKNLNVCSFRNNMKQQQLSLALVIITEARRKRGSGWESLV